MIFESIQNITKSRLFSRKETPQSIWQIIVWWELRRIPYNLMVGSIGVISSAMCLITGLITEIYLGEPIGIPNPPLFAFIAVLLYVAMANLCYTGGWLVELIVRKVWPEEGKSFGTISFTMGLLFSLILTLLPGILVVGTGGIALLRHVL